MSKNYPIHKGVPIPEGRQVARKYPFLDMGIGDCFTVAKSHAGKLHSAIQDYKRRYGLYFVTKSYTSDSKRRIRVWRVAPPNKKNSVKSK